MTGTERGSDSARVSTKSAGTKMRMTMVVALVRASRSLTEA